MRKLIQFSLQLQFLIIVLAVAFVVFGFWQLREMPVDVFPEFDPPIVEVQTESLGLSASEIEAMITVPLEENMLNGVAWLDQIYSESVAGLSSIRLVFESGTDPLRARQMVEERLSLASHPTQLPNVSKQPPTVIQPLSTTNRVMMVGLSSKTVTLIDIGVLARWHIKPRLMGVPGVANVAIWGNRDRQLQVQVDPKKLQENNVTLDQIIRTTGEALWDSPLTYLKSSAPGTAGFIDTPNQRLNINHILPISMPQDLGKVSVTGSNGLFLGDVTKIVENHQPLIGDAIINNNSGLLLVIEKLPGANTLEVTAGVEKVFDTMRPGLTGIEIDTTVFRPADYIKTAIGNVGKLMLMSLVLVVFVIEILFGLRTALISLVVIPISLMTAVFILYVRGASFNMMVWAALVMALGFIIDDVVIDVDNIVRRLKQNRKLKTGKSSATIILDASLEMRSPIIFATLIIFLALTPLLFMPGLTGTFFQPMTVSFILALSLSLVVALVLTPALSLTLLQNTIQPRLFSWTERLEGAYGRMLARAIKAVNPLLFAVIVIIFLSTLTLPFLKLNLMPAFKQSDLLIQMDAKPNTSLQKMIQIITKAEKELRSIPGVKNTGAHIGRAITGDQTVGINSSQLWVTLDPVANHDTTVTAIEKVIANYPGLYTDVQSYQPKRLKEAFIAADQDLIVRIYGPEMDILREKAQEVRQIISGIDGITQARVDDPTYESQVEIEVYLSAAKTYLITPGDVRRQATTLLSGLHVGNLYEEQKIFDVVVWGVPEIRGDLNRIGDMLIETPKGRVPLKSLAEVRIRPNLATIKHQNVSLFADVAVTTDGQNTNTITADITRRLKNIKFPFEYHAELLGESSEQQTYLQRIPYLIIAVAVGSLLLLQAAYWGWRIAFVSLVILPSSLIGGLAALIFDGGSLSLGSLLGFFTILGIAVRNGLVMVSHFHHLQQYEGERFGQKLIVRGSAERLRPVLLTAAIIGLTFLPFALSGNIAGTEIIHEMSVVILGGLVSSTLLTLFVLPTLYLSFGPKSIPAEHFASGKVNGQEG